MHKMHKRKERTQAKWLKALPLEEKNKNENQLLHLVQTQYNQKQKESKNVLNISFSRFIIIEYFNTSMVTGPRL
jgi:hypothetical protein